MVLRHASATGSGTRSIISRIQVRVISGVSDVKNGASFAAIHLAKSRAMTALSASIIAFGMASGLSSVLTRNGVAGATSTSLAIRSDP